MHREHSIGWSLLAGLLVLAACKREERGFKVEPPFASTINTLQMSGGLQPAPLPTNLPVINHYEQNAYALSEGKRLFSSFNCSGCHAHGGGNIGPPLMDDQWIYGSNPENIFATIVQGRPNGMPSFAGKIPDYQVWQIAGYVRSMSGLVAIDAAPARNDDINIGQPENSRQKSQPRSSSVPPSVKQPQ
jgi:cytochrome c oxidase cbb3-type subunit III